MNSNRELKRVALEVAEAVAAACGRSLDDLDDFDLDAVIRRARQNHGQDRALNFAPVEPAEYLVTFEAIPTPVGSYVVTALVRTCVWDRGARAYRRPPLFVLEGVAPDQVSAALLRAIGGALETVDRVKVGKAPRTSRALRTRLYKLRHRAQGLCERCPRPAAEPGAKHCEQHRAYFNAYQVERRLERQAARGESVSSEAA